MGDPTSDKNAKFYAWLNDRNDLVMRVIHDTHRRYKQYEEMLDLDRLVKSAFRDVFDERRHPPTDIGPAEGMFVVISSKVRNWLDRERRAEPMEDEMEPLYSNDPTDLILIRCYIRELVTDDRILKEMVELWIQDPKLKPRDFPEVMEISIGAVYDALDRLRRRIRKERCY